MQWESWYRFDHLWENPFDVEGIGVYEIRATDEAGKAIPIPRSCGTDEEGILYIGEGNLASRVGLVKNMFQENPKPHHQFCDVFFKYAHLYRIADPKNLEIRWAICEDCKSHEKHLIDEYTAKFGDLPPGNLKPGG